MADTLTEKGGVWDTVMELTKSVSDPNLWAIRLGSILKSAGLALPSVQLSHLLVSCIRFNKSDTLIWKFIDKALAFKFVPPMLVLALLSARYCVF